MRCPNCHAEIPNDAVTCPTCGLEIEHEPTVTFVPEVAEPAQPSVESITEGFALVVERGPRAGLGWVLKEGVTTVGRHPDSDIFLDDITVSRHHCRLILDASGLTVEDSGSTNGTYVNGERVDRAHLAPGDEVIVGKFRLVVASGHA